MKSILRIGDKLYERELVRIEEGPLLAPLTAELSRKYVGGADIGPEAVTSGYLWLFELAPRICPAFGPDAGSRRADRPPGRPRRLRRHGVPAGHGARLVALPDPRRHVSESTVSSSKVEVWKTL